MFIKSTNEYLSSLNHLYDSLEKHLGEEYLEVAKEIIEAVPCGYTDNNTVEHLKDNFSKEIDSYTESLSEKDTALSDIREICENLLETIEESKRLSRKEIIDKIEEIENIAYRAY